MKFFIGFAVVFILFVVLGIVLLVGALLPATRSEEITDSASILPHDLMLRVANNGSQIELSWSSVEAEGVTFVVQRSATGGDDSWEDVSTFGPSSSTYSYTEPRTDVNYIYRIHAFTSDGSAGFTPAVSLD